jgi:CRP-like cAMP-binding protein
MTAFDGNLSRRDWNHPADAVLTSAVASVPLFATLGRRQVRKIAHAAEVAGFCPGDVVLGDADRADFFYVVLDGAAELREDGRAHRLRPGDYFGEAALVDGAAHRETVIATDELEVLRVPAPVLRPLAERSPTVAFAMLEHLGRRVQGGNRQVIRRAA